MFVHMAIDTLGAPPERRPQLDKIQSDLFAAMAPAREASNAVISVLADGVAAGNIDKSKVDAAVAKELLAAVQVHAATLDALTALHNAILPTERAAIVEKVAANAAVWKKVNTTESDASKENGGHLAVLTQALGLTSDQVDKISTALKQNAPSAPDSAAMDAYITTFSTTFVADKFDAKALPSSNAVDGDIAKYGTARMVRFYEIVTPLLTPDQRAKLADRLRQRLSDRHANASTH